MNEVTLSKSVHRILADLTGEERFDVALHLATKDLVCLKLKEAEERVKQFEERYRMNFEDFKKAWDKGRIPNKHSYEVERDYWEWEAAMTDRQRFQDMLEQLP